jgi:hypothetical protein
MGVCAAHHRECRGGGPLADGPGQLQDLQGPSYLYAILTDARVRSALARCSLVLRWPSD